MNIQMMKLDAIHPYEKNPRRNDDAVRYVQASIKEFGFKQPIVIDKNNVIVAGHTRYKASKNLKLKEVPVVIADDLAEEQIKAYRLADNKVSEKAVWDDDLLGVELDDIIDIDMEIFGFEDVFTEEDIPKEKENERLRTDREYNLELYDENDTEGFYQMPIIHTNNYIPEKIRSFNYALTSSDKECGIHFFIDDYQFERVWNSPQQYTSILNQYECIFSPDFSLYMDMPIAMKIWNVYRSRLIGQYYQNQGIRVIPTVSWGEKETFEFCFDGIEEGGIVAVSTIGVKNDPDAFQIWKDGMQELMKRKKPQTILVYGGQVEFNYGDAEVVYFDNENTERMKK